MKTFNFRLTKEELSKTIDIPYFLSHENILIQIFCGAGKKILQDVITTLNILLPEAICIGTTTDGEIGDHKIYTKETIISISVFHATQIRSAHVYTGNSFSDGQALAKELITTNSKLLILFTDGTTTNGEDFLKGIESINNTVVVAGGMAGDNGDFIQTYISEGTTLLEKGAVGVSLNSDKLSVHNDYSFNWNPIGVMHKIDKVENNRVYSIDGISPVDFYAKYLGEYVADALPATGIEFPLIIEKGAIQTARAVIAKHDDGSLSFAGNLHEGDIVRLGFGNAEMIINNPSTALEKFCDVSVESFFLYSCMARRRYMPGFIQVEIEPFAKLAPVAGFFTYAEFYHHNNHNELLNQTLTAVALSESLADEKILNCSDKMSVSQEHSEYATTIQALTHLIQQSTADLEAQSNKLKSEKQFSQKLLANQKLFMRQAVHETMTPLSVVMSNIELFEIEQGKNSYLSNIEAAMKNIFTIYDDLSYHVKKNQLEYPKHHIDLVDYIRSRIEFFSEVALQTSLSLDFICSINEAPIYLNETKLQRIIDNNLTNAIKYTLENESIIISLAEVGSLFNLSFSSKSTHIQHPDKVFEAYYREGHNQEGFGLGLNLVKQICEEEDIRIQLESDEMLTCFSYLFTKGKRENQ